MGMKPHDLLNELENLKSEVQNFQIETEPDRFGKVAEKFQVMQPLIVSLLTALQHLDYEKLPHFVTNLVTGKWQTGRDAWDSLDIDESNKKSLSPEKLSDLIRSRFRSIEDWTNDLLVVVPPLLALSDFMSGDIPRYFRGLSDAYAEAKEELDKLSDEVKNSSAVARSNVEESQRMLTYAAAAKFRGKFKTNAIVIGNFAQWWLFFAILCAAGVVAAAVGYQPPISVEASSLAVLQALSSKAALVGIFFGAAVWCGRIYRSQLHQVAVNEHRQLSLDTFQAFMAASPNDHTRDAVLLAATNAVFGNQPTGLGGETSSQEAAFNIGISGAANGGASGAGRTASD